MLKHKQNITELIYVLVSFSYQPHTAFYYLERKFPEESFTSDRPVGLSVRITWFARWYSRLF